MKTDKVGAIKIKAYSLNRSNEDDELARRRNFPHGGCELLAQSY
jgi:hypothetical protein